MANDQRVLARVSGEEAREYIRGVNAHLAKHTGKYRWPICGCVASFVLGAVLFGVMMGVFFEENRLRCNSRLCERGEDPLVDGCCVFWCCGEDMEGRSFHHELPARPYNTSWDVWSSEIHFGITERCSFYDEEHQPEGHTKRDANYGCGSCPATLADEKGACKHHVRGPSQGHEVTWPLLFLSTLPAADSIYHLLHLRPACAVPRLFTGSFCGPEGRGSKVTHVTYQRGGKHSPNYLRLWFPPGQAMQMQPVATGRGPARHRHVFGAGTARRAGGPDDAGQPCGRGDAGQIPAGMYPGSAIRRRLAGGARHGRRRRVLSPRKRWPSCRRASRRGR